MYNADTFYYIVVESHMRQSIELPYFSKYLLIASYLASYNPAKSDKKFFVKVSYIFYGYL